MNHKQHQIAIISIVGVVALFGLLIVIAPNMDTNGNSGGAFRAVSTSSSVATSYRCYDSDGGQNFLVKGTTTLTPVDIQNQVNLPVARAITDVTPRPQPIAKTDVCRYLVDGSWITREYCHGINCFLKEYYCSGQIIGETGVLYGVDWDPAAAGACEQGAHKFFDLEITSIEAPASIQVGQASEVLIHYKNNGNLPGYITGGSFCSELLNETNSSNESSSTGCGGWGVAFGQGQFIEAGESGIISQPVTLFSPGVYKITTSRTGQGFFHGDALDETDYDNNEQFIYLLAEGSSQTGEAVFLGEHVTTALPVTYTEEELDVLQDTTINFQGTGINVHDSIILSPNLHLAPETSLTVNDNDYDDGIFVEIEKGAMEYCYVFDEQVDITQATNEEPLEINFVGNDLPITYAGSNFIQVDLGKEMFFNAGDSTMFNQYIVTLDRTSNTAAIVTVTDTIYQNNQSNESNQTNGTITSTVSLGSTKVFFGLQVKVESIFNDDGVEYDSAVLKLGEVITKVYYHGDAYIGENEDDPNWVWAFHGLDTPLPSICVRNDFVIEDANNNPITEGGHYALPDDFAMLEYVNTYPALDSYTQFDIYTSREDLEDAGGPASAKVVVLETDEDNAIRLVGANMANATITQVFTDKVYLHRTGVNIDFYYDNHGDDDNVAFAGNIGSGWNHDIGYVNEQTMRVIGDAAENMTLFRLTSPVGDKLQFQIGSGGYPFWNYYFNNFGVGADYAEAAEVQYDNGDGYFTHKGLVEDDLRTRYGMIIESPRDGGDTDHYNLWVPKEQVYTTFRVFSPYGSSGGGSN